MGTPPLREQDAEAIKRLGLKPDTYWTFAENYCEFYKS